MTGVEEPAQIEEPLMMRWNIQQTLFGGGTY